MRLASVVVVSGLSIVAAGLLAGCTSHSAGTPTATTTSTQTGVQSTTSGSGGGSDRTPEGAPKVKNPLDVSEFVDDPCGALTAPQSRELNVGDAGKRTASGCTWANSETGANVDVQFAVQSDKGLGRVYQLHDAGELVYFAETEVEGFPAVDGGQVDDRSGGGCIVTVGVSDQLSVQIGTNQSNSRVGTSDPCAAAHHVASMIMQTMKAGA